MRIGSSLSAFRVARLATVASVISTLPIGAVALGLRPAPIGVPAPARAQEPSRGETPRAVTPESRNESVADVGRARIDQGANTPGSATARAPQPGASPPRRALVIGNGAYRHARGLLNPRGDAAAMAAKLRELGFDIVLATDVDLKGMKAALRQFIDGLPKPGSGDPGIALVYFAGHGVQIEGRNYLIPVDAAMQREYEVPDETVAMDMLARALEETGAQLSILVLDCCRDNPFSRSWRGVRGPGAVGLAMPRVAPAGMFIAYATSPESVAMDGEGSNSPYTAALLRHLGMDAPFEEVFKAAGRDVAETTAGRQQPWFNSKFYGSFSFARGIGVAAPPQPSPAGNDMPPAPAPAPAAPAQAAAPQIGAATPPMPERGYWGLDEIFDGAPYDAYSAFARGEILQGAQENLKGAGLYVGVPDGAPGPSTHAAILAWQARQPLPPTGRLDPPTLRSLGLEGLPEAQPVKPVRRVPAPQPSGPGGRSEDEIFREVIKRFERRN